MNNFLNDDKSPGLHSLGHALLAFAYISCVALLMFNGQALFGNTEHQTFLMPVMMLSLFVLSATITGTLILGRPILMYWDGKKKEAMQFLGYTVAWFAVILLWIAVYLISLNR